MLFKQLKKVISQYDSVVKTVTNRSPRHLLDVVILLQDGQGDRGALQRGQADVGGLSADHVLTGQSPVELDLVNQTGGDH